MMADKTNEGFDYEKHLSDLESKEAAALSENKALYEGQITQADKYYNTQIQASKNWADKQTQLQQEQTDFAIEKIEQQKDQAQKDYTKEQSGAYVDWQKQSNQYGAVAEQAAANGLTNTGYTESSQVSMYNTYQNRVATARESYNRAVLNYDNAIKDAILQNNSILAEIAYEALQKQLELSLAGFQYKNQLLATMTEQKNKIKNDYMSVYNTILGQMENQRQFNENLAEEQRQFGITSALQERAIALDEAKFAYQKAQDAKSATIVKTSGEGSGGGGTRKGTAKKGIAAVVQNKLKEDKAKYDSGEFTVDQKSVLALGFGPISEKRLNELVESGVVQEYVDGNKLKFKLSPAGLKNKQLFG